MPLSTAALSTMGYHLVPFVGGTALPTGNGVYIVEAQSPCASIPLDKKYMGTATAANISLYWKANETILYVGSTKNLRRRISGLLRMIGGSSSRRGGLWLAYLDPAFLSSMRISYVSTTSFKKMENDILCLFAADHIRAMPASTLSIDPLPFANRELKRP